MTLTYRGTKDYTLAYNAGDQGGEYRVYITGTFPDLRSSACSSIPETVQQAFGTVVARFFEFTAVTLYDEGPALQYLYLE